MQTTTANNIADYYLYDGRGKLVRRTPDLKTVQEVLAENPEWVVRRVQFIEEPAMDINRAAFEEWAMTKASDWFGYDPSEYDNMFERDSEGYTDCGVHSAWMGWNARNEVNNEVTNG